METPAANPVPPSRLDQAPFEHRAGEEKASEHENASDVEDRDGIPAQQVQNFERRRMGAGGQNVDGGDGGEDDGAGDVADARADDRGRIPRDGR